LRLAVTPTRASPSPSGPLTAPRGGASSLLGARRERPRGTADELECWQRAKVNVETGSGQAQPRDRHPAVADLQRHLGLPAHGAARLQSARLVQAAGSARLRAGEHAERPRFRLIAVAGSVGRAGRRFVLRLQASHALFAEFIEALTRIGSLAPAQATHDGGRQRATRGELPRKHEPSVAQYHPAASNPFSTRNRSSHPATTRARHARRMG
jgi:hypothetical protein